VVVRFASGQFGPLVRDLVSRNPFVGRAPVDLDLDSGFLLAQDRYRLPSLDGVGLAGSGFVMRHPRDRGLRICEDTNLAKLMSLGPARLCCVLDDSL